jgi:hypothetical protein
VNAPGADLLVNASVADPLVNASVAETDQGVDGPRIHCGLDFFAFDLAFIAALNSGDRQWRR